MTVPAPHSRASKLRFGDLLRTAWLGVTSRPQRTALAALGIALGIASLAALTGVSASNQAALLDRLDRMGANLAIITPGQGPGDAPVPLPPSAPETVSRVDGVAAIGVFETPPANLAVYRTDLIPSGETNGIGVQVARPDVLPAIEGSLAAGKWFDNATRRLPVTVLGSVAAERLGIDRPGDFVWIGDQWYGVLGILDSAGLAEEIDASAILGDQWVRETFTGADTENDTIGDITSIYVRAEPGRIDGLTDTLTSAASPGSPFVRVSTLGSLADARATTDSSLSTLGFVLGGIALLIGAVGIANTMVVTVLERRGEIGLRRSLGARPVHIAAQFVGEAGLLSCLGGAAGLLLGTAAAIGYALITGQPIAIPAQVLVASPAVAILVGMLAGLAPSLRAAKLSPSTALRGT